MKVLLDSDILLDYFLGRDPYADFSEKVLNLCDRKELYGFITPVILANVYYILRKNFSRALSYQYLSALMNIIEIVSIERTSVLKALQSDFIDFEDALQNFSAEDFGIQFIFTRNLKDYKKSSLKIFTPEEFLKTYSN